MLTRTVRPLLAEQYADMLAQDYRLRNVLLSSYHHDFSSLLQFDRRMQTYLDGMLLLKEETSEYLRGQLQERLSPGSYFLSLPLQQIQMMNFCCPDASDWYRECLVFYHHYWP